MKFGVEMAVEAGNLTVLIVKGSGKGNTVADEVKSWLEASGHSVFIDFDPDSGIRRGAKWKQTL